MPWRAILPSLLCGRARTARSRFYLPRLDFRFQPYHRLASSTLTCHLWLFPIYLGAQEEGAVPQHDAFVFLSTAGPHAHSPGCSTPRACWHRGSDGRVCGNSRDFAAPRRLRFIWRQAQQNRPPWDTGAAPSRPVPAARPPPQPIPKPHVVVSVNLLQFRPKLAPQACPLCYGDTVDGCSLSSRACAERRNGFRIRNPGLVAGDAADCHVVSYLSAVGSRLQSTSPRPLTTARGFPVPAEALYHTRGREGGRCSRGCEVTRSACSGCAATSLRVHVCTH